MTDETALTAEQSDQAAKDAARIAADFEKIQQNRVVAQAEDAKRVAELKPFIAPTSASDPGRDINPPTETAQVRLRAFEDKLFGADCVRIRGQVERGYGSKFKDPNIMTDGRVRHYDALEKLVVAEQTLADAHTALIDAENSAQAASDLAEKTEAEIDAPAHE